MSQIPDYNPDKLEAISGCLQERYGENVPFEQVDHDLQRNKAKDLNT